MSTVAHALASAAGAAPRFMPTAAAAAAAAAAEPMRVARREEAEEASTLPSSAPADDSHFTTVLRPIVTMADDGPPRDALSCACTLPRLYVDERAEKRSPRE